MHQHPDQGSTHYQAIIRNNIQRIPQFQKLSPELRLAVMTVAAVLPFRANRYVIDELIDWERVPQDPIFQLTFPQEKMLSPPDFAQVRSLVESGASAQAGLRPVALLLPGTGDCLAAGDSAGIPPSAQPGTQ